jgi:hypothetical protein
MTIRLTAYLGHDITELLNAEPFVGWHAVRSVDTESKHEVWYEFDGHGVEVICDLLNRIKSIFIHRGGASLVEIPFAMGRQQTLERFGQPAGRGEATRLAGIGELGPWDRFVLPEGVLHIQYCTGQDEIDLITLMRPDVVP